MEIFLGISVPHEQQQKIPSASVIYVISRIFSFILSQLCCTEKWLSKIPRNIEKVFALKIKIKNKIQRILEILLKSCNDAKKALAYVILVVIILSASVSVCGQRTAVRYEIFFALICSTFPSSIVMQYGINLLIFIPFFIISLQYTWN